MLMCSDDVLIEVSHTMYHLILRFSLLPLVKYNTASTGNQQMYHKFIEEKLYSNNINTFQSQEGKACANFTSKMLEKPQKVVKIHVFVDKIQTLYCHNLVNSTSNNVGYTSKFSQNHDFDGGKQVKIKNQNWCF